MASPGPFGNQMQQGFWPNSPQPSPSPFGMNNQMQQGMSPMSQQGMNPMSPQGMNPMNQNMMFNQMNPSGFGGNLGNIIIINIIFVASHRPDFVLA